MFPSPHVGVWPFILGVEQTTFIIGPDGVISHMLQKVKPAEHDAKVVAALAAPKGSPPPCLEAPS